MSKQELIQFLKENLHLEVRGGSSWEPNYRTIKLFIDSELICQESFDVTQKPEYSDY